MFRLTMTAMILATLAVAGCASDPGQTITGRINAGSFPEAVTHVRAIGSTSVVDARVAADGSFLMRLPAGERYRIEMVSAVRASDLVFPRPATGTLDTSFYIAASGDAFDFGMVTYVKDPEGSTTIFDQGGGGGEDGTGGGQDTGEGGGEDGAGHCGAEAAEPDGGGVSDDGAVAEHTPDQALNCDGDGGGGGQDTGEGGGQDTGGGGQDTGGGGQDSGGGGGG